MFFFLFLSMWIALIGPFLSKYSYILSTFVVVAIAFIIWDLENCNFCSSDVPATPVLTSSIVASTIQSGSNLILTCTSTVSDASLTYTFMKDSTQVQSSTSNIYAMSNVIIANGGSYTCLITVHTVDSVASSAVVFTIVGECIIVGVCYMLYPEQLGNKTTE